MSGDPVDDRLIGSIAFSRWHLRNMQHQLRNLSQLRTCSHANTPKIDTLPTELALNIANFLNPAERWRFSVTSRRYRELLPVWHRIKIHSPSSHSTLKSNFYVSPASTPDQPLLHETEIIDGDQSSPSSSGESLLQYGVEYLFWTYDYERENVVFLGRHGQKLLYQEDPRYLYTLGLRPMKPNQTWKILPHKGSGPSVSEEEASTEAASPLCEGEPVPYTSSICLTVAGRHPKPYRPDSSTRLYLSAHSLSSGALWYVIHNKEWCIDEQLQILPSAQYPALKSSAALSSSGETLEELSGTAAPRLDADATEDDKSHDSSIAERELVIHAIPDILDGGCSLYSPQSMKHGEAACMLHHTVIRCHFWIQDGILTFHAFTSLKFKFGVPILEEDQVDYAAPQEGPLAILLKKNSSRWWAIKHYMSTAVDVEEGRAIKMDVFLRDSKDHEDHTILYDEEKQFVHIDVQDAVVDTGFPDVAWDKDAVWKFLLCG